MSQKDTKSEPILLSATTADIPALEDLVNSAYRGERSRAGWTSEADIVGGLRIDAEGLKKIIASKQDALLTIKEGAEILGCVHLSHKPTGLYLSMLTVRPTLQGKGTGALLLKGAEDYARAHNEPRIYMSVISVRKELIAYYERKGYVRTQDALIPFVPAEDYVIVKTPLFFATFEKFM